MNDILVSIVIPTYNRFEFLIRTIQSCEGQSHGNIEIIVVNDASTEQEYYSYPWKERHSKVKIIHLRQNTRKLFGRPCSNYCRNEGIRVANGTYIAFCDDDDSWFPKKIELQLQGLLETPTCRMSCTDALYGEGPFDTSKDYPVYNREHYYSQILQMYTRVGHPHMIVNGFPKEWQSSLLKIHNLIICSSVLMEKSLLHQIGMFHMIPNGDSPDHDCWLRALEHTHCLYIDRPLVYYDGHHGYGQNY